MKTALIINPEKGMYNDHTIFMVSWWERDSYFNNEKIKQGMLYLLMLYIVHQDHLDHDLGKKIMDITHIHVKEAIFRSKTTPINGLVH